MKNIWLTLVIRPRSLSGVFNCRMVLRMIELTESDAPAAISAAIERGKLRELPKITAAIPIIPTEPSSIAPIVTSIPPPGAHVSQVGVKMA